MINSSQPSPEQIVRQMLENDAFSQWLGIQLLDVHEGTCTLECILSDQMLNGFNIAHGGILFSLADSAIAFASSSYGRQTVAIDHSISFIKKANSGDTLTVTAKPISMGYKTGVIHVNITNQNNKLVAVVKGTVYRTSKTF